MLQKLYKLGKLVPAEPVSGDSMAGNPLALSLDYREEHAILLCFEQTDGVWEYRGCETEKLDPPKLARLLFKTRTGNWRSPFPTVDIFRLDDLKHGDVLDFARSKAGKKFLGILANYGAPLAGIRKALTAGPRVAEDLAREARDLTRFLLSLSLDGRYLADSPFIAEEMARAVDERFQDYYTYNKKKYEGRNQLCSLGLQRAERVWGCDAPYKFYAVKTELGSVPGGFDARTAWKNFPLSQASLEVLFRGQHFLEENLRFRLCGFPYFLLPEPIRADEGTKPWFSKLVAGFQKLSTGDKRGQENLNRQADLMELLAGEENDATFTLLFFEENNSEFRILSSVEEVFPSYNRALLEARRKVEASAVYKDVPVGNDRTADLKFSFEILKTFFPNSPKEGRFGATFLKLVRAVFMGKTIAKPFLLQHVMRVIRERFFKDELYKNQVLQAFLLFEFLIELKLLDDPNPPPKGAKMDEAYESFFQEHHGFFQGSAAKKAVFLKGVLCRKLLDIQWARSKATPFRSRLGGLKLNARKLKALFTEIINKLTEYDANFYSRLEKAISRYLLVAGDGYTKLEGEEYGFLFVLGMNLADEVEHKKNIESKEPEEP